MSPAADARIPQLLLEDDSAGSGRLAQRCAGAPPMEAGVARVDPAPSRFDQRQSPASDPVVVRVVLFVVDAQSGGAGTGPQGALSSKALS